MSTRKVVENGDENSVKRRKVDERREAVKELDTASFSSLPLDCKVLIFSNLTKDELNIVAEVNKECNVARNNESLPQQRTGTFVTRRTTTTASLCEKLEQVQERNVFSGNRTRMKAVWCEGREPEQDDGAEFERAKQLSDPLSFPHVTHLDFSRSSVVEQERNYYHLVALSSVFPGLLELDGSNNVSARSLQAFIRNCPLLTKITWNGGFRELHQCGYDIKDASNLTHFFADDVQFSPFMSLPKKGGSFPINYDRFLFYRCHRLAFLSIKGATVRRGGSQFEDGDPLPQGALIKMVRRHPTLRWLRSDLSPENVEMLKRERPEITFVSE